MIKKEIKMRDRVRLIQEDYIDTEFGPWKVLSVCQCLNRAAWPVAEVVATELFEAFPNPYVVDDYNPGPGTESYDQAYKILGCLGLGNRRAKFFTRMCWDYTMASSIHKDRYYAYPIKEFMGCGQYAQDAWLLFVLKKACSPTDRLLRAYAERKGLLL